MGHDAPPVLNPDSPRDEGDTVRIRSSITQEDLDGNVTDISNTPDITIEDPDGNDEVATTQMSKHADGDFYYEWDTSSLSYTIPEGDTADFLVVIEATEAGADETDKVYVRLRN